jgi:hypothetical protein
MRAGESADGGTVGGKVVVVVVDVVVVDVEGATVVAGEVDATGSVTAPVESLPSATGSSDPPSSATNPHAAAPTISTRASATAIRRTTYRR